MQLFVPEGLDARLASALTALEDVALPCWLEGEEPGCSWYNRAARAMLGDLTVATGQSHERLERLALSHQSRRLCRIPLPRSAGPATTLVMMAPLGDLGGMPDADAWRRCLEQGAIVSVSDPWGRILFASAGFQALFGGALDQLQLGGRDDLCLQSDTGPRNWRALTAEVRVHGHWQGDWQGQRADGQAFRLQSMVVPILHRGQPAYMELAWDVTALAGTARDRLAAMAEQAREMRQTDEMLAHDLRRREQAQTVLHDQHLLLHSILSSLPEQILVLDRQGRIVLTNAPWERYRNEQASADSLHRPTRGDDFPGFLESHTHAQAGQIAQGVRDVLQSRRLQFSLEYRDAARDGDDWFLLKVTPWQGPEGGAVVTLVDVGRNKRLSAEHKRLVALAENTCDLIAVAEVGGDVTYLNQAAREFYGSELAADDRPWAGDWVARFLPLLHERGRWSGEMTLDRADGAKVPVLLVALAHYDDAGMISHISSIARDISQLRRNAAELENRNSSLHALNRQLEALQDQLLQTEKLASVGLLASGVAQEVNGPIAHINSNLSSLENYLHKLFRLVDRYELAAEGQPIADTMARMRHDLEYDFMRDDLMALLGESRDALVRVRKIVQDLRDFSHAYATDTFALADIHGGIDSTLNVAHNEIKYKAQVITEYGDLPLVECMLPQLNQAFMNLLINASQAIDGFGKIWIRTRQVGEEVCIEIEDSGRGIAPATLSRIFEPFFSTREGAKGLGLPLAYGIVQKHRGRIEVVGPPGQGACFRIWLPLRQSKGAL